MFRTRLVLLALAASLGLISGCSWSTSFGFGRIRQPAVVCPTGPDCCPMGDMAAFAGASPVTQGPILPPVEGALTGTQDGANLPVAPMPRLVPSPQSQPVPYAPSSAKTAGANLGR